MSQGTFDYGLLKGNAKLAKDAARSIHGLLQSSARAAVEIGRKLCDVQNAAGEHFAAWLRAEFEWSQGQASNYMRAFRAFGELDCLERFQPTALYELARDRVKDAAVAEAVERARAGETITRKIARDVAAKHGAAPGKPEPKPDALYRLRAALQQLASRTDQLLSSVPRHDLDALATELLQLSLQIRTAIAPAAGAADGRPSGRAPRRPAAAAAG